MWEYSAFENGVGVNIASLSRTKTAKVYNRTGGASVVGQVYELNMSLSDGATTVLAAGGSAGATANAVKVTATGRNCYPLVVCNEVAADDALMEVILYGPCTAFVKGSDLAAVTDALHATTGDEELDTDEVAGARVVGLCLAATANGTGVLASIYFDGRGIGTKR
jgi:hypothetical protein